MRSRQARKIVRMVKYTPIDRMSSTWFDRALQWCATYRQPQIKKALRYYWNGVADGKVKPSITKKNFQETNSYEKKNCKKNIQCFLFIQAELLERLQGIYSLFFFRMQEPTLAACS